MLLEMLTVIGVILAGLSLWVWLRNMAGLEGGSGGGGCGSCLCALKSACEKTGCSTSSNQYQEVKK